MSQQASPPEQETSERSFVTFCARHPKVETALRCGRCETPICPKCSIPSPVGARCPTCAQVKRFVPVVKPLELARAVALTLLAVIGIATVLRFIPFFGVIGAAGLGYFAGWFLSNQVRRRRGTQPAAIAVACFLVGWLISPLVANFLQGGSFPLDFLPIALMSIAMSELSFPRLLGVALGGFLAWLAAR